MPSLTPRSLLKHKNLMTAFNRTSIKPWDLNGCEELLACEQAWPPSEQCVGYRHRLKRGRDWQENLVRVTVAPCVYGAPTLYAAGEVVWDEVAALTLKSGRTAYLHRFMERLTQRAYVQVADRYADPLFSPGSFAYRKRHSPSTALYVAKTLALHTSPYAKSTDLSKFFDSTDGETIERGLSAKCYPFSKNFVLLGASFGASNILHPPEHPTEDDRPLWEPSRGCLLQGSISAPLIANMVAHVFVDAPFAIWASEQEGSIHLLRYADDILVLAESAETCERAFDKLHDLLEQTPWRMNVKKTSELVDLRNESIGWLGMQVSAGAVAMDESNDSIARLIEEAESLPDDPGRETLLRVRSKVSNVLVRHDLCSLEDFAGAKRALRDGSFLLASEVAAGQRHHQKRRLARLRSYDRCYNRIRRGTFAHERTTREAIQ